MDSCNGKLDREAINQKTDPQKFSLKQHRDKGRKYERG